MTVWTDKSVRKSAERSLVHGKTYILDSGVVVEVLGDMPEKYSDFGAEWRCRVVENTGKVEYAPTILVPARYLESQDPLTTQQIRDRIWER